MQKLRITGTRNYEIRQLNHHSRDKTLKNTQVQDCLWVEGTDLRCSNTEHGRWTAEQSGVSDIQSIL